MRWLSILENGRVSKWSICLASHTVAALATGEFNEAGEAIRIYVAWRLTGDKPGQAEEIGRYTTSEAAKYAATCHATGKPVPPSDVKPEKTP